MESIETTLQVNKFARRNRHLKVFSGAGVVRMYAVDFLKYLSKPLLNVLRTPALEEIRRFFVSLFAFIKGFVPVVPQKRLLFQAGLISSIALFATSLTPGGTFTAASMTYSPDYIGEYAMNGDILVSDEDGYLIKMNPQTSDSSRVGMTDYAVHTIESGESLSLIAQRYGVKVETIMWENNLSNANSIRSGQKLLVPPVDGISYTVKNGDNLERIAKKYEISVDSIIAQNGLESEVISKGQHIFLPGTKPLVTVNTASADYRVSSATRNDRAITYASSSEAIPAVGRVFIVPTMGKVTQGYRSGHYAIDFADTSKPPVWAAGGGTVIKASSGTWGGGYGNHVIIDHGNGLQTLYGHLETVNVYEGQWVSQGDVIGIMGNTGRVYGITGIHLHFEVILNGTKQNPANYY